MRRFVSRTLLYQHNALTKGLPVRLSQHYRCKSDETADAVQLLHPEKGSSLARQHRISLPILDAPVPLPTVPPQAKDEIFETINSTSTLSQLLESVYTNVNSMNEKHLTSAIRKAAYFQENSRTAFTVEDLHKHRGFIAMCRRMRKVAPSVLNPQQLINYLKALMLCAVGSDTKIVQTLLHMIKGKVNDLTLQQIIFLDFLLDRLDGSLVDALKVALPMVFESQLKMQLDIDNVEQMSSCLRYATTVRSTPQTIEYIANGLYGTQTWSPMQTCQIILSIGKVRNLAEYVLLPLLELALGRLGSVVDQCDEKKLQQTFVIIGENYSALRNYWYNEMLCQAIAKRAVREKWNFKASRSVGQAFSKMGFVNIEFLDHFATLIAEAPKLSATEAFYSIGPFAVAHYKPTNFEAMMKSLLRFDAKPGDTQILFRFALASAILDVFPHSVIQSVFKDPALDRYLEKPIDFWQLCQLNRAVSFLCPDYPGPFLDRTLIERGKEMACVFFQNATGSKFPLKAPLEFALGGPSYVESGMFTKLGHMIDHVLVLRPGLEPVAINTGSSDWDSVRHVEEINVPVGSQMLLITVQRPNHFVANAKRLRGVYALELRTLESAGYNVMAFDLGKWESLPEHERIPFLKREILNKVIFPER